MLDHESSWFLAVHLISPSLRNAFEREVFQKVARHLVCLFFTQRAEDTTKGSVPLPVPRVEASIVGLQRERGWASLPFFFKFVIGDDRRAIVFISPNET